MRQSSSTSAHAGNCGMRRKNAGFSLIELMIAVAVIAILSAIAYASYQSSVVRTRRSAAAACLQEQAQLMERYYTTNLKYEGAPDPTCDADVTRFYAISFVEDPTEKAFELQAVPQEPQATNDAKCGTLTLDQKGVRGVSGSGERDACW